MCSYVVLFALFTLLVRVRFYGHTSMFHELRLDTAMGARNRAKILDIVSRNDYNGDQDARLKGVLRFAGKVRFDKPLPACAGA